MTIKPDTVTSYQFFEEGLERDTTFLFSPSNSQREGALKRFIKEANCTAILYRYSCHNFTKPKLVVFDLDGTLVKGELLVELALNGTLNQTTSSKLLQLTTKAIEGKGNWRNNYMRRIKLLEGVETKEIADVYQEMQLADGATDLIAFLKQKGVATALITGAWKEYAEYFAEKCGIDHCFSTELEVRNGQLTGKPVGAVLDAMRKQEKLEELAKKLGIALHEVVIVADGYNDLNMMMATGCSFIVLSYPNLPTSMLPILEELKQEV